MNVVDDFLSVVRDIIKTELDKKDDMILCEVVSRADIDHYNIRTIDDVSENTIQNVPSVVKTDLRPGDFVYVYKINNRLDNAFILSKEIAYSHEVFVASALEGVKTAVACMAGVVVKGPGIGTEYLFYDLGYEVV